MCHLENSGQAAATADRGKDSNFGVVRNQVGIKGKFLVYRHDRRWHDIFQTGVMLQPSGSLRAWTVVPGSRLSSVRAKPLISFRWAKNNNVMDGMNIPALYSLTTSPL